MNKPVTTDKPKIRPGNLVYHIPTQATFFCCGVSESTDELLACIRPTPKIYMLHDCVLDDMAGAFGNNPQASDIKKELHKKGLDRFIEGDEIPAALGDDENGSRTIQRNEL